MKVISYQIEIEGVNRAITNQDDLKNAIRDVSRELSRADFGTEKYDRLNKQLATLKNEQKENRAEQRLLQKEMQANAETADDASGAYRKLSAQLTVARTRMKDLAAAGRENTKEFKELEIEVGDLDNRLKEIDANAGQFQRNVGNYASAFADLGGLDLGALATGPGAIAAVGAAAIKGAQQLAELTDRFREFRGVVQTVTGATGTELEQLTARIAGIADTFDAEFNEIVRSAERNAEVFGISFDESLNLIEEGFIAGSNLGGDFLDLAAEYAPVFDEIGFSANQAFRFINQTVTSGIYSDQGLATIEEAQLRLRELPQATQDALEAIGLTGEEIRQQIDEEGIGAAITTVSKRLQDFENDSREVGVVLADVFGAAGEKAGADFVKSLGDIETATGSLIDETNEYQLAQQRTLEINQQFAAVQNEVAKELSGSGVTLEQVGTQLKTGLLQFLLEAIREGKELLSVFSPVVDAFRELGVALGFVDSEGRQTQFTIDAIKVATDLARAPLRLLVSAISALVTGFTNTVRRGREFLEFIGVLSERQQATAKASQETVNELFKYTTGQDLAAKKTKETSDALDETNDKLDDLTNKTRTAAVATDTFAEGSIAMLRDRVRELQAELEGAAPGEVEGILSKLLNAEAALEEVENFQAELRNRLVEGEREIVEALRLEDQIALDTGGLVPNFADLTQIELDRAASAIKANSEEVRAILQKRNADILREQERLAQNIAEVQDFIFTGIADSLQLISESSQATANQQIAALERRYEREIQLAEGNTEEQEKLEQELADEREKIQREEFERQKELRVAAALASLAEGIVNILSAPTTIPDPFGAAFKALRIGFLTAQTTQQIANINKQSFARGGEVKFGKFGGKPHSAGGTQGVFDDGTQVEVERGEVFAILNRKSSAMLEKLSALNVAGGGRSFGNVGASNMNYFAAGGVLQPDVSTLARFGLPTTLSVMAEFSDRSIDELAARTGNAVYEGTRRGSVDATVDTARIRQRQERVRRRVG